MRWSKTLIPTLMQPPADAPSAGHAWMIRAGLARMAGAGQLAFLPLGVRSLNKLAKLAVEIYEELGFAEVFYPGASAAGAPGTEAAAAEIRSYRQLPQLHYQVTRGGGMPPTLTAFGVHADAGDAAGTWDRVRGRMTELLGACRIKTVTARTARGEALAALSPAGETKLAVSDAGDYAASIDVAETGARAWNFAGEPKGELEKLSTPGMKSVGEVCAFLKTTPDRILKTLVFAARSPIAVRWVVAVVRGDHAVNLRKLAEAAAEMGVTNLTMAEGPEAANRWPMGFVGPEAAMRVPDAVLIVDPDAAQGNRAWIAGGNEADVHVRSFNWFRECGDRLADPSKTTVADIRNALDGDPSPRGQGTLRVKPATVLLELTTPTSLDGFTFDDASGRQRPLHVAACSLDLQRTLLEVVNASHDPRGIVWPRAIAPASVVVTAVGEDAEVRAAAEGLYTRLSYDEIDTVLDDRDARPGSKFADADLVGFSLRLTVGTRSLQTGSVEMKLRGSDLVELVPLDDAPLRARQALSGL